MSNISNNDIARAIYLASKDKPHSEQASLSKQTVEFLARKHLLGKSEDILARLEKIIHAENGVVVAKVSTAQRLSTKEKHDLGHILAKRYSAKEVKLEEHIDERLLGGFRVEVNDEVIDLTLRDRMDKLQEYLTRSA